ncbi:MAG: NUDIX domain-containing protein [Candidatus Saccharimonas sp.]
MKGSKTPEDLLTEISEGETTLEDREGVLVRIVDGVGLHVFASMDGHMYKLREDRQVFKRDGTIRRRGLSTSLGEKIKKDETVVQAMVRALSEELGILVSEEAMTVGETSREMVESDAYPGIMTDRGLTYCVVTLTQAHVRPEGYVERQPDKDNFFVWELIA